jgi:hypothetical protein
MAYAIIGTGTVGRTYSATANEYCPSSSAMGRHLFSKGGMKSALGGLGVMSNGGRHDGVVMLICIEA